MDIYEICGKKFNIIMNASGCYSRTYSQLKELCFNTHHNTIITKTCTKIESIGNVLPNYKEISEDICINALGIPNEGYYYYKHIFLDLIYDNSMKNINYIISMDTTHIDDLCFMLKDYDDEITKIKYTEKQFIELNISCPNLNNTILSYDIEKLTHLLNIIDNLKLNNIYFGVKCSPYLDKSLLTKIALLFIKHSNIIKYIVCSNTIPNGLYIDLMKLNNYNKDNIYLTNKFGGISGVVNKYISLSNIYQFNMIFKTYKCDIKIIGCGGIFNYHDILEYLYIGSCGVQIGYSLYSNGIDFIKSIYNDLLLHITNHNIIKHTYTTNKIKSKY